MLARRKERERRRLSDYSCSVGAKEKGKGDGLATTVAVLARRDEKKGKGDSLATTVAVLARRKERERRQLSDYRCSVGATKRERRRLSDYRCSVGVTKRKGKETT